MTPPGPKEVKYIGSDGPLQKACELVFQWQNLTEKLIVILWHPGWIWGGQSYWKDLHKALEKATDEIRILVAIADETPDVDGTPESRRALKALLRALAVDTAGSKDLRKENLGGWCCITDFKRLAGARVLWKRDPQSSLIALAKVAASRAVPPSSESRPSIDEFFHFLDDPVAYRTKTLHGAKPEEAVADLRTLKWLDAAATYGPSPKLKVLIIENQPEELSETNQKIGKSLASIAATGRTSPLQFHGAEADFYLVKDNFETLIEQLRRGKVTAIKWNLSKPGNLKNSHELNCSEIDLILQDIVLGEEGKGQGLSGLDLAPEFYQACPQALVFLITNLDVETLVGSGDVNWKYVDCIVSKQALATLWYEYRRCFRERFGKMFWADWGMVEDKERRLLRNLFGSLRRWQIEPDILWHGQTLPEMIDHANRHVSALWKLVNEVIGTIMERGGADPKVLSLRHRIALSIAIWMHDVGHRGDEYFANSMDIRAAHAGISERLLLRNPEAYSLGWLLDDLPHAPCTKPNSKGKDKRLACRNRATCFKKSGEKNLPLCILREAGLLCRHHQSNAPLDVTSLQTMAKRGKEPSVYSLVPDERVQKSEDHPEDFLRKITNDALPPPSPQGVLVRTLEDFTTNDKDHFRALAGVLRMLDALQIHRARVGSAASIKSFQEFLAARFGWCKSERVRLEEDRRAATPGKKNFQKVSAKLDELGEYEILLNIQGVHYWRQAAVHEIEVRWRWQHGGKATLVLDYCLDDKALQLIKKLKAVVPDLAGGAGETFELKNVLDGKGPKQQWMKDFEKETFGNEHKSQYGSDANSPVKHPKKGYLGAMLPAVDFEIVVSTLKLPAKAPEKLIRASHA
jgi:hypothetical protein